MLRQLIQPTRTTSWNPSKEMVTLEHNPAWTTLAGCQPRQINGATYSQMIAGVQAGEVLVARLALYVDGRFYPQQKEVACWIANSDSYNALVHGSAAGNREIIGYYAVTTERLLSLLFS